MKIATIIFALLFSSSAFAEWTKIITSVKGNSLYLDKRTVKISGDIRFFLYMQDYLKPTVYGDLSSRSYAELNCNNMMSRDLIKDYFSLPLAEGTKTEGSGQIKNPEWMYYEPDTSGGVLRIEVCKIR
mgnify:CR=1 FL=1|tara:strand:- start:4882 stop:5265 length:384 start_codon:yes stop_codon:yes gene_type:complete